MNFNCLIPELRVFDLEKSKKFYTEILGFSIAYQREDFAMVVLEDCQIMLQKLTLPSPQGSWNVSEDMKYPLGRGINFQIILPDISKVYNSLKREKVKIFTDLLLSDYQENSIVNHVLEFLVQDPDGYLLRFQQDITDWQLGDNQKLSDELFSLVLSGEKTATSYLYDENEKIESGFSVLTNWKKTEKLLIETTRCYVTPFGKVTGAHAFKEGEQDKTLDSWRKIHKKYFEKLLKEKNLTLNDNTKIVCEEFKLIKILEETNE